MKKLDAHCSAFLLAPLLSAALVVASAEHAWAQQPAPPAPPADPAPPAAPPPAEAPAAPPAAEQPPEPPTAAEPVAAEPTAAEPAAAAPAAAEPEAAPVGEAAAEAPEAEAAEETFSVTTGVGLRVGARFQDLRNPDQIDMFSFDSVNVEPRFSGRVTKIVGWTANLTVEGRTATTAVGSTAPPPPAGPPIIFEVRAMDLIGQLDFMDEFHIWAGRMLTPSDRSNFSGAWFMSPWEYPGVYNVPGQGFAYVGPRGTEEIGREVGTVVWGDVGKGKFKYYAGMMDVDDAPATTPLYVGRLHYTIIGSEPGFYGSSTYYGAQNVVAVGAAGRYQKRWTIGGAMPVSDSVKEFNADLLAELVVDGAGTFTAEGAYYHFDSDLSAADDAFFVVASYLTPNEIGIGKIQPLVRYQQTMGPDRSIIEGYLSYVMKDYFAKLMLGFEHTDMGGGVEGNAVRMGFQVQQ